MKALPLLIVATLACAATFTSCGRASDTVNVTLRTGLENTGRFKNLMNGLTALPTINGSCIQKNLYAVSSPGDSPDETLDLARVPISTGMGTVAGDYPIDALWIKNNSTFPPITVPVPRGVETGVGVVGSLSWSMNRDPGRDTCADFDAAGVPYSTTSVLGHTRITASTTVEVPMKVWVLPVNASPQSTPAAGDPQCESDVDSNQNCPSQDFLILTCDYCSSTPQKHLQLEYAIDRQAPEKRVIQWIPANTAAAGVQLNIPSILPLRVRLVEATGNTVFREFVFSKNDFPFTGARVAAKTVPPGGASAPSGYVLTLTERARRLPPIIPSFSTANVTQQGVDARLSWSPQPNATSFKIMQTGTHIATVPGGTGTYVVTGLTANASYAFQVIAENNLGSAPITSATLSFVPIGGFSPAPSFIVSGSPNTISVNCGTALGGSTYTANFTKISGTGPASQTTTCSSGTALWGGGTPALATGAIYNVTITATNFSNGVMVSPSFTATAY